MIGYKNTTSAGISNMYVAYLKLVSKLFIQSVATLYQNAVPKNLRNGTPLYDEPHFWKMSRLNLRFKKNNNVLPSHD